MFCPQASLLAIAASVVCPSSSLDYRQVSIAGRWRINLAMNREDPSESIIGLRVYRREGRGRRFIPTGPTAYVRLGFGYPERYKVRKVPASGLFLIVGTVDTMQNSFSDVWIFDGKKEQLLAAARGLLNASDSVGPDGAIRESANARYINPRPPWTGEASRVWRLDPAAARLVPGNWRRTTSGGREPPGRAASEKHLRRHDHNP